MSVKLEPICDCGAPGDKHDDTGWSCATCRAFVKELNDWLEVYIRRQRKESPEVTEAKAKLRYAKFRRGNRDLILRRNRARRRKRRAWLKSGGCDVMNWDDLNRASVAEAEARRLEAA
jgi:hypothetical protein